MSRVQIDAALREAKEEVIKQLTQRGVFRYSVGVWYLLGRQYRLLEQLQSGGWLQGFRVAHTCDKGQHAETVTMPTVKGEKGDGKGKGKHAHTTIMSTTRGCTATPPPPCPQLLPCPALPV